MPNLPCDYDPDEEVEEVDLLDALRRSLALVKGERHLNAVPRIPDPISKCAACQYRGAPCSKHRRKPKPTSSPTPTEKDTHA